MFKKPIVRGMILLGSLALIMVSCVAIIASPSPEASEPAEVEEATPTPTPEPAPLTWEEIRETPLTDDEIAGPITVCQTFVKRQLKAPSTTKFPVIFDEYQINRLITPENAYNVEGHFDAQNGFGAMLRARFGCKVERVGEEEWRSIAVDIRE